MNVEYFDEARLASEAERRSVQSQRAPVETLDTAPPKLGENQIPKRGGDPLAAIAAADRDLLGP
jgi:hypothetical protein